MDTKRVPPRRNGRKRELSGLLGHCMVAVIEDEYPACHRRMDRAANSQRVFKEIKDEFVPLKAAYLRRFFPSNDIYKQIRDALLESETIVCDGVCYQADSPTWRNQNDRCLHPQRTLRILLHVLLR